VAEMMEMMDKYFYTHFALVYEIIFNQRLYFREEKGGLPISYFSINF